MTPEYRQKLAAELREAERAAASPYVDYPATPRWYEPAIGLWAAAFTITFSSYRDSLTFSLVMVGLIVIELIFIRWLFTSHGAMPWPGFGKPPAEIRPVWNAYFAGCVVVVGLVALTWWQVGPWWAAGLTFVLVTGGLTWYDRAYAAAAQRVRERLA